MEREIVPAPKQLTPLEFYDHVMSVEHRIPPAVALNFSHEAGPALNFFRGWLASLKEQYPFASTDDLSFGVKTSIERYAEDMLPDSEQKEVFPVAPVADLLGVWPRVFDVISIEREAERALQRQ